MASAIGSATYDLCQYTLGHTDVGTEVDVLGTVVDMVFFKVAIIGAIDAGTLRDLVVLAHLSDPSYDMDLFDGEEHSYLEIGGFLGSQELALRMMALGTLLNLWNLLTPATMIAGVGQETALKMAGAGYISIQSVYS